MHERELIHNYSERKCLNYMYKDVKFHVSGQRIQLVLTVQGAQ